VTDVTLLIPNDHYISFNGSHFRSQNILRLHSGLGETTVRHQRISLVGCTAFFEPCDKWEVKYVVSLIKAIIFAVSFFSVCWPTASVLFTQVTAISMNMLEVGLALTPLPRRGNAQALNLIVVLSVSNFKILKSYLHLAKYHWIMFRGQQIGFLRLLYYFHQDIKQLYWPCLWPYTFE